MAGQFHIISIREMDEFAMMLAVLKLVSLYLVAFVVTDPNWVVSYKYDVYYIIIFFLIIFRFRRVANLHIIVCKDT